MVKQGEIIRIGLGPRKGHEQDGYRPAVVVSGDKFNAISKNIAIVCPITTTNKTYPFHVELDNRTRTYGTILCDHVISLDISTRGYSSVESVPDDILDSVLQRLEILFEK